MNAFEAVSQDDVAAALSAGPRLRALEKSGLMDTAPEEVFDRATRLASRVLGVPVGLLSLVDAERQFFKAQVGLEGWAAAQRGTPLSHSFCQHVVASDAPLVVRDSRAEPLVRENLAVADLRVVAYLGVPVHSPDGEVLGSLCAISGEPQDWTRDDLANLQDIVSGVESEISVRFALAASREQEDRVRSILDALPVGVALAGTGTGALLYVNGCGVRLLGSDVEASDAAAYVDLGARHADGSAYAAEDYPLLRAALHGESIVAEPMIYDMGGGRTRELEVDASQVKGHALAAATFRDVTARNTARRERDRTAQRMAGVLAATTDAVILIDADWRIVYANEAARGFALPPEDIVGRTVQEAFPDIEETPFWETYVRARETGEPQVKEEIDRYSGKLVEVRAFPRAGELILVGRDVAEERRAEAQRKVIVRELNHRVKNLFAVISGMIGMTARSAESPEAMARTLRGRVAALARAHDMIRPAITSESVEHDEASLAELVRAVIEPHLGGGAAPVVEGPEVALGPQSATSLALALHELATNAVKYGAFRGGSGGRLSVRWTLDGDRLRLVWDEEVEGAVTPPEDTGFGTTLIEMSTRVQMQGELSTEWRENGVRVSLDVPAARLEH